MSDNLDRYLEAKFQACALNFNDALCDWFGQKCSIAEDLAFAIQFTAISLKSHRRDTWAKNLPGVIETVNKLVEKDIDDQIYNDPRYSFRVYIAPKAINNRNKADQAVTYAPVGTDIEMAIREVERPKYRASQIVEMMQNEGFRRFTLFGKGGFVEFWKKIDAKKQGKGYGVEVAGVWYWYETMVTTVRNQLSKAKAMAEAI